MSKEMEEVTATGRRKRSVASVRLRPGKGNINVNGRPFETYFASHIQRDIILAPLTILKAEKRYDVVIRVNGGGVEGQVIATRLGLSRALIQEDERRKGELKPLGFLTRDSREKERKKYGHKKARKSFQFTKR